MPAGLRRRPRVRMTTNDTSTLHAAPGDDAGDRRAIVRMAAEFAAREIAPRVAEYDRAEQMPRDLLDKMGALGFFGGVIPEALGGLGLDYVTFAELIEEVSKTCQILGTFVS